MPEEDRTSSLPPAEAADPSTHCEAVMSRQGWAAGFQRWREALAPSVASVQLTLQPALSAPGGSSPFTNTFPPISFSQTHLPPICLRNIRTRYGQNN